MDNGENNQNNVTEHTSMRGVEATTIGNLRTEKIGRPILVVELLVIFVIVIVLLPFAMNMINDENSVLYSIFHGNTVPEETPIVNKKEYDDGSTIHVLDSQTSLKFNDLILKKFILTGNKVVVDLSSYNGILNLDEKNYYLQIYSTNETMIAAVKLIGTYDNAAKTVELTSYGLSFNSAKSYTGKIVEMQDRDYPEVVLPTDESGIGSFKCTLNNRSIEYLFKNNYLIGIKDTVSIKVKDQDSEADYLNLKKKYDEKASILNGISTNVEESEGFIFNANIDLENYNMPEDFVDYDYFKLDTEAKIIKYQQTSKGFGCE